MYERSCEEETILVVINVSDKEKQTAQNTSGSLLWSFDHKALTGNTLPPQSAFIIRKG